MRRLAALLRTSSTVMQCDYLLILVCFAILIFIQQSKHSARLMLGSLEDGTRIKVGLLLLYFGILLLHALYSEWWNEKAFKYHH